ncbi:MAG TPA: Mov34/MPN/PAD-1 family protein [Rubricoccaceae bacterium]|jgi:proteasome lid subunit RPN8/RPN11
MTSWLRRTTRALVSPGHRISCDRDVWEEGQAELRRRGGGHRESGAFLLGAAEGRRRRVERFVYYDDVDPHALDSGVVDLDGAAFGPLWSLCRRNGLSVVADVHTHPRRAFFSPTDRANPMVDEPGHLALVLPDYAAAPYSARATREWALYEYLGCGPDGHHRWADLGRPDRLLHIGRW